MKAPTTFACRAAGLAILAASAAAAFAGGGGTSFPMGDIHQCSATAGSCSDPSWVYHGTKVVTCCCQVSPNVWKYCDCTIGIFEQSVAGQTWHCYRLMGKTVHDVLCFPIPNPNPDPVEPVMPDLKLSVADALRVDLAKPKPLLEDRLRAEHILTGSCTWEYRSTP